MKQNLGSCKYYIVDILRAMNISYTATKKNDEWNIIVPLQALTKVKHNIIKDLSEFNNWTYKSYKNYIRLIPNTERNQNEN